MSSNQPLLATTAAPAPVDEQHPRLYHALDAVLSSRLGKLLILGVPLIALSALACTHAEEAIGIALGCNAIVLLGDGYRSRYNAQIVFPDYILTTVVLVQVGIAVALHAGPTDEVRSYMGVIIISSIAFVVLASIVVGKPFTLQHAAKNVKPEVASHPGFVKFNVLISLYWLVIFVLMDVCVLVSVLVFRAGSCDDDGGTNNNLGATVFGTVVPLVVPILGGALMPRVIAALRARYAPADATARVP